MIEKYVETLKSMGFKLDYTEDSGYDFRYEGASFLLTVSDDEEFLNLALPGIIDRESVSEDTMLRLANKMNSTLKYIKCNIVGDGLWLFYEREIFGGEDEEKLIARMILRLESALYFFRKLRAEEEAGGEE